MIFHLDLYKQVIKSRPVPNRFRRLLFSSCDDRQGVTSEIESCIFPLSQCITSIPSCSLSGGGGDSSLALKIRVKTYLFSWLGFERENGKMIIA